MTDAWIERLIAEGIQLRQWREGGHKAVCPGWACKHRAARRERDLYVRVEWDAKAQAVVARWHCYHCSAKGSTASRYNGNQSPRELRDAQGKSRKETSHRKAGSPVQTLTASASGGARRGDVRVGAAVATLAGAELRGGGGQRAGAARAVQVGNGSGGMGGVGGGRQRLVRGAGTVCAAPPASTRAFRQGLKRF